MGTFPKISEALRGKKQSQETVRKRVEKNRGQKRTLEQRERMSNAQKGRVITEEHRKKLVLSHLGKRPNEDTRKKHSLRWRGEKNPLWNGGTSFLPYCSKFTRGFRERVRAFFGYRCVECGELQGDEKLSIHHVNYNKNVCCDDTKPMFVALCRACHTKTNWRKDYWRAHFTEIVNTRYNGQSYISER